MWILTYLRAQWDRAAAAGFVIIGIVALLLGYDGVRNTGLVAEQLPYIVSGGMLGLFLLGLSGVLRLSADLRDEWCNLDDLETVLTRIEERLPEQDAQGSSSPAPESAEPLPKAAKATARSRARVRA